MLVDGALEQLDGRVAAAGCRLGTRLVPAAPAAAGRFVKLLPHLGHAPAPPELHGF
jgi:hypothetical protein